MKKTKDTKQNTLYQKIVDTERKTFNGIADKVVAEITTLLDSSMSAREMSKVEITTIAGRLIKFQTETESPKIKKS